MASFLDVVRFTAVSSGTGDFVVSALVTGYQTPATAGAVTGAIYRYRAENAALTEWEVGYGAYTVGSVTLARTTVLFNSLGTTAKISFTAPPQVGIVALSEDLIFISPPQGRLTLATGTPVMTTTQSAKTTVFYALYIGNQIPIYDGTAFANTVFSELSQATTDTTKSPAAVAASSVYDIFVWNDAGTLRATRGPAWTNDTARGYSLSFVNGIYLNTSSITNGPAASRGTWVGTIRSNASSQIDWIFGTNGTTTQTSSLYVWNLYNRINVSSSVGDSTTSWTYNSTTWRQIRAQAANQINVVVGSAEDALNTRYCADCSCTSGAFAAIGIGINSTSSPSSAIASGNAAGAPVPMTVEWGGIPAIGVTSIVPLEATSGGTGGTYYGSGGAGGSPTGVQQQTTINFRM